MPQLYKLVAAFWFIRGSFCRYTYLSTSLYTHNFKTCSTTLCACRPIYRNSTWGTAGAVSSRWVPKRTHTKYIIIGRTSSVWTVLNELSRRGDPHPGLNRHTFFLRGDNSDSPDYSRKSWLTRTVTSIVPQGATGCPLAPTRKRESWRVGKVVISPSHN